MLAEVAARLDAWVVEQNVRRWQEGLARIAPCRIRVLGQTALLEAGVPLHLNVTNDVDVRADYDHAVQTELERLLAAEGKELDPVGHDAWMPRETRYTDLFVGEYVTMQLAEVDAVLLSKAIKAPDRTLAATSPRACSRPRTTCSPTASQSRRRMSCGRVGWSRACWSLARVDRQAAGPIRWPVRPARGSRVRRPSASQEPAAACCRGSVSDRRGASGYHPRAMELARAPSQHPDRTMHLASAVFAFVAAGCGGAATQQPTVPSTAPPAAATPAQPAKPFSLSALRARVETTVHLEVDATPAPEPPAGVLERVSYAAPLGDNVAYVTPVKPGERRAAMVWIAGGFDWGIGASAWTPGPRENDQSAATFREAGIALMLPALRGSNGNPGHNECLAGEVDDVIAAARYLATRPDVDPARIYLGGHSTGGTLALLVAQSTDLFRAVFAFGPVADAADYHVCPIPDGDGDSDEDERALRRTTTYLSEVRTPTFVIEGAGGNSGSFAPLEQARGQAPVRFVYVPGANHFDVLAPGSEVVAAAVLADADFGAPDAIGMGAIRTAMGKPAPAPAVQGLLQAQRMAEGVVAVMAAGMAEACTRANQGGGCEGFDEVLSVAAMEGELALAYTETFSAQEIEGMARFYASELGRKVAATEFALMLVSAGRRVERPEALSDAEKQELSSFKASAAGQAARLETEQAIGLAVERYAAQL